MSGRGKVGGALPRSPGASGLGRALDACTRYHPAPQPDKWVRYCCDGKPIRVKGQPHGMLLALLAAGQGGVARAEVQPWASNTSDSVNILEAKGVQIERRKGKPYRYVLASSVMGIEEKP